MGKWRKGKKKNSENTSRKPSQPATNYVALVRENASFERYYKAQCLVSNNDWDTFMTSLKTDLPAAFRLTGSKSHAKALAGVMEEKFFGPLSLLKEEIIEGEEPIRPLIPLKLPWYPSGLAWQLNLTRRNIKKSEAYWKLHQFLISETETGNISRQEAVSMIPPIVLGVKPHHKVLDMCAAPGSKTAQLIEFLHSSDDSLEKVIPEGVIVANDADNKRCYMLTHQINRLQSPAIMVTNHDAAFMPNIHHTRKDGSTGPMKFDRVLCDVPCSGDGTLRKNYDVWSKWNHINGANLHGLQMRIARRGLEMLTVGGRLVYSTCSMNPLENEAVIARLIQDTDYAVQLIDVTEDLPGLKITPGMEYWKVLDRELEIIESVDDIPLKSSNTFHKHLFPPEKEIADKIHLQKCIRVLPHHQDSGGFFVAVLEKTKLLPGEKVYVEKDPNDKLSETKSKIDEKEEEEEPEVKPPPKKKRCFGFKEEPYYYFEANDPTWPNIESFYNIRKDVVDLSMFLTRTMEGKRRIIYFTNRLVKDLVTLNQYRVKIINTGVKVLVRSDNKGATCDFRLAQDGSQVMLHLINDRKISMTREDIEVLLLNNDMEAPPEIKTLHQTTQDAIAKMVSGSTAFIYKGTTGSNNENPVTIELVGWIGKQSVRGYVAKNDRLHYLRLINVDTSKFDRNKFAIPRNCEEKSKTNEEEKTPVGECKISDVSDIKDEVKS